MKVTGISRVGGVGEARGCGRTRSRRRREKGKERGMRRGTKRDKIYPAFKDVCDIECHAMLMNGGESGASC